MSKKIIYECDIKNCGNTENIIEAAIQCIRTTDTTEGRACKRYLVREKIDICEECYNKILNGAYVTVYGAQGYNTFELHECHKK
jgi:hypothetical protein